MPKIQEYVSRTSVQGPVSSRRATAEDLNPNGGFEAAGKALSEVGDVVERRAQQADVSDLNAKMSEAHAQFTVQLQETLRTADPGDRTIADKFTQQYDDYMSKLGENVATSAGRNYFTKASAEMRAHFIESAHNGQADLAGVKAKEDYTKSISSLTSSLLNDPSSEALAQKIHDTGVDNLVSSGLLSKAKADELKITGRADLAKSAIRGWVNLNPEQAKEEIKGGRWDGLIDGDVKHQMLGEAEQGIRGKEIENERLRREQERQRQEAQSQTQNAFLEKLTSNQLTNKDILKSNLDAFGSGSKEQFLQLVKASNEGKMKTDPGTYRDLFNRIHLPDEDPKKLRDENELNQYVVKGRLSFEHLNQLRAEIQGKRTPDGEMEAELKKGLVKVAEGKLTRSNPMLGLRDVDGDEQMQKFMTFFLKEFDTQKKSGKSAAQLLSPESPDYLGRYISNYTRSPNQIMKSLVGTMNNKPAGLANPPSTPPGSSSVVGPPLPPSQPSSDKARRPDESPQAYLKRIGKD
jgi:hypothetical protein